MKKKRLERDSRKGSSYGTTVEPIAPFDFCDFTTKNFIKHLTLSPICKIYTSTMVLSTYLHGQNSI